MRVSLENTKYLNENYPNWQDVGITPWYDHYNNGLRKTTAFEITKELYSPANPFTLPSYLKNCICKTIT